MYTLLNHLYTKNYMAQEVKLLNELVKSVFQSALGTRQYL